MFDSVFKTFSASVASGTDTISRKKITVFLTYSYFYIFEKIQKKNSALLSIAMVQHAVMLVQFKSCQIAKQSSEAAIARRQTVCQAVNALNSSLNHGLKLQACKLECPDVIWVRMYFKIS